MMSIQKALIPTLVLVVIFGAKGVVLADTEVPATVADPKGVDVPAGITSIPMNDQIKAAILCRDTQVPSGSGVTQDYLAKAGITSTNPTADNDWCLYLVQRHNPGPKSQIGLSNPKVQGVGHMNPGFGQCLMNFVKGAESAGHRMTIHSGYRTCAAQAAIFASSRPGMAAKGCNSRHNKGLAADLAFSSDAAKKWAHANVKKYGLEFLSFEPWHVQNSGSNCKAAGSVPQPGEGTTNPADTTMQDLARQLAGNLLAPLITPNAQGESPLSQMLGQFFSEIGGSSGGSSESGGGRQGTTAKPFSGAGEGAASPDIYVDRQTGEDGKTRYSILTEDGTEVSVSTTSALDAINRFLTESGMSTSAETASITFTVLSADTQDDIYRVTVGTDVTGQASLSDPVLVQPAQTVKLVDSTGTTFGNNPVTFQVGQIANPDGTPSNSFIVTATNVTQGLANGVYGFVQKMFGFARGVIPSGATR